MKEEEMDECRGPRCCGGMSRRRFLGVAAGAAGWSIFGIPGFAGASPDHKLSDQELQSWFAALPGRGIPLRYRPRVNPAARLPLGGTGCGNVYLGVDGALRDWLIFNNLFPLQVPDTFFAVRARAGGDTVTRVLQTAAPEGAAAVADAQLTGEYPFAFLDYIDDNLPVDVRLEAFTPLIPLDSYASAYPAAVFRFRLKNKGLRSADVSLMLAARNSAGRSTPGGNVNALKQWSGGTSLLMRQQPGRESSISGPVAITACAPDFVPAGRELPEGLSVRVTPQSEVSGPVEAAGRKVIWLENPGVLDSAQAHALSSTVAAGATLVISGAAPFLRALEQSREMAEEGGAEADILLEDFESGTYSFWTVEGEAFGDAPQEGTLPHQNPVTGFQGRRLANSFVGGDDTRGRLLSKPFAINRDYVRFLVGGGAHRDRTQVNLLVDGKAVRSATGANNEQLGWHLWNVKDLRGRQARLEILDDQSGGWGHINADHFTLTNSEIGWFDAETQKELEPLLPFQLSGVAGRGGAQSVRLERAERDVRLGSFVEFPMEQPEGTGIIRTASGEAGFLRTEHGEGEVYLAAGSLLSGYGTAPEGRQAALTALAALVGERYVPPAGALKDDADWGDMCISVMRGDATARLDWQKSDDLLKQFASSGSAGSDSAGETEPSAPGETLNGAISAAVALEVGEETDVTFLLTWRFPNYYFQGKRLGNFYAKRWPDSVAVAKDLAENLGMLWEETERYRSRIYESTLPYWFIDCVTSQASTIRSEVCIWTDQDTFAGYEGSGGCCPMNCTHVWGYEQTVSRLFPDLEKRMRFADLKLQQREDGGINHRISLPLEDHPTGPGPFADGQAAEVMRAYREHLNSPDDSFLRDYYPNVRRAVEYLVGLDGPEPDGVLEVEQWNTYDDQVTGPNSFIGSYYLAALRAGEEMAKLMGDSSSAVRWRTIFETGRRNLTRLTWNGEYFYQNWPPYAERARQYGPGCLADQLIGQWWAHQLGLGYLLPETYVKKALKSIYRYNWLSDMSEWRHSQRVFADGHDKGLLCCSWPRGGRPAEPILYCDEVWTGVEYQVASHMLYEGMVEEALAIVAGARERYDGKKRNPWDELECGGHYARAMSSWSLLLGASRFYYDGPRGAMAFDPVFNPDKFRCFFTSAEGWGLFTQQRDGNRQECELRVDYGRLILNELRLGLPGGRKLASGRASVSGSPAGLLSAARSAAIVRMERQTLQAGQALRVRLELDQ